MQFLNLMIQMQIVHALRAHAIWFAFENLLLSISPKLYLKYLITNTNCCENYFDKFHLK